MTTTTEEVVIPPAISGTDAKEIMRKLIRNLLSCNAIDRTQNAYAHMIMTVRLQVWPIERFGPGALTHGWWWAFKEHMIELHKVYVGSWDGEGFTAEEHVTNSALNAFAAHESTPEVMAWWRSFLVEV